MSVKSKKMKVFLTIGCIVCASIVSAVKPLASDLLEVISTEPLEVVAKAGFTLGYSEKHEQPAWVSYRLSRSTVRAKRVSRKGQEFREDSAVKTGSAQLSDYRHSGYDRGHLAPAASMSYSSQAMSDSFLLSNASPQNRDFNSGIWAKLEQKIRYWATVEGELYVITGPILPKQKEQTIGFNEVTVPKAFYKAVYSPRNGGKAVGFILPNAPSNSSLDTFAVTIDKIEAATGLDFFSALPDSDEMRIESGCNIRSWKW